MTITYSHITEFGRIWMWLSQLPEASPVRGESPDWSPPILTPESSSSPVSVQEDPVVKSPRPHKPAPMDGFLDCFSGPDRAFNSIPELYPRADWDLKDPVPVELRSDLTTNCCPTLRATGEAAPIFNPFEARLRTRRVYNLKARFPRLRHPEQIPDVGKQFAAMTQKQWGVRVIEHMRCKEECGS